MSITEVASYNELTPRKCFTYQFYTVKLYTYTYIVVRYE